MSEVASFGNIVNSLLSLRDNYHEQLKSVPQYEAYLHVQGATEKAAGALHASADSPASIAAEVIDSLQFARSRFEQHLNSIPEYRTLLAIDKLIREIAIDLGVLKPEPVEAPHVPEAAVAAPEPEHHEPAAAAEPEHHDAAPLAPELEPEADPVVATVRAIEAETIARAPVESPLQPSHVIDLDEALATDDDIVQVHVPRPETAIEGGEDHDLLDIVHRDAAKPADETAEPHAPHAQSFSEDSDEAAA